MILEFKYYTYVVWTHMHVRLSSRIKEFKFYMILLWQENILGRILNSVQNSKFKKNILAKSSQWKNEL
jgi:hypothetical protein